MGIFRRIWALGKRARLDREIESELREHMDMYADQLVAQGMDKAEAEREARLRFGNPTVLKEKVGAADAALSLDSLARDTSYALRGFAKNPGFTLVAIATLALGIGANTAVFQLVDAVRMRSLPIIAPQELAVLRIAGGKKGFGITNGAFAEFTVPMWKEIRDHHNPFSGVMAWRETGRLVGDPTEARHVHGLEVSGSFFNVLGIAPWQGRLIEPQDESACRLTKAVVSYPYWKGPMGGQPITPNTLLTLNGNPVQILGVTPPSFFGVIVGDRFDIAYPTCMPPNLRREMFTFSVMGRLKPDWSIDRASAYFVSLSPGLFEATAPTGYPEEEVKKFKAFRLAAEPAGAGVSVLREAYDPSLTLLLAITGLVLLIACANLANLMMARANKRQREMAIRVALGASRLRIVRQLLIESALLALTGAGLGVALAQPLSRLLVTSLSTARYAIQLSIATDWRVLVFSTLVAGLTCLLFGTVPAIRGANVDPMLSLKAGQRGLTGSRQRFSLQRLMVIAQVAVSMVLLVGALLFVRSYFNLATIDTGMRASGVIIGRFGYPKEHIKPEEEARFKRNLIEDVRSIPGIQNAAGTTLIPLSGDGWSHVVRVGSLGGDSMFTYVSPSYFTTMGIALLSGRSFSAEDSENSPYVLIVNQAFARKYFAGADPVGQPVHVLPEPQYPDRTYTIVGTIADTKYGDLRGDTPPQAFVPIDQLPVTAQGNGMAMMIVSDGGPRAIQAIQHRIQTDHPGMILQFSSFEEGIRDSLVRERMLAILSGAFGSLAVLLVIVGLYGVLSYLISQRSNEIGIRIALGATRRSVIGVVMRDTGVMMSVGLALGTLLALLAGHGANSLLFGLKAYDPLTLGFATVLLALVAALTSWLPARKAARLDPVAALRSE
jgi:predicted permease